MTKVGTFFDINKSTTTNHIKFKRLPRQSWLKSTLKRFLNHSNNRYLEQKIYQKTTTNNLNSYRNLSQQSPNLIFHITINYLKLLLYSPSLIGRQLSKLSESIEVKALNKDTFSIMNKIWRLLLQENTPIYTKNVYCLVSQWTFHNYFIQLRKKHATISTRLNQTFEVL